MHGRVALVVLVVATVRSYAADWKDGCPTYFPPETAPGFTDNLEKHDGSASFGTSPEVDSPLGGTRVAGEMWYTNVAAQDALGRTPTVYAGRVFGQLAWSTGPLAAISYGGGYLTEDGRAIPASFHLADFHAYVGYRHTGYLLGPTFRIGTAIRIGGGGPLTGRSESTIASAREQLAIQSPLHASLFGVDQPMTLTLEERIEMVGCHNPFLDLRIDAARWKPNDVVYDVPIELAGGAYLLEDLALFGAIAEDFRTHGLLYHQITRTSLGVEFDWGDHQYRIGARGSAITGDNITGFEFDVMLTWRPSIAYGGTLE